MHPRIQELLTYLDEERRNLRAAFDAVPRSVREQAPDPARWSAANIIEHIALVERRFASRFAERVAEARAAGIGPETSTAPILQTLELAPVQDRANRRSAPEPTHPTGLGADAAWRALEDATVVWRAAILEGDGLALSTISMPHRVFGPLSLYHWIAFAGAHEHRHADQIREIAT